MSYLLHINGWPGSGKRTIGRIVADRIRGRLLDNHMMLNPAEALSNDAADTASFERYRRLAERRDAQSISVILDIAPEENARRLLSPGRSDALKLNRVDVLEAMRVRYRLLRPSGTEMIDLDVTKLSAAEAVGQIVDVLMRPSPDTGTGARLDPTGQR